MGTGVDQVAGQSDSVATAQMNISLLRTDNISGDGDQAGGSRAVTLLHDPDVPPLFGRGRLDCIRDNRDFIDACSLRRGIDPDFRRRRIGKLGEGPLGIIVFNIVPGDLEVSNF